MSDSLEIDFVRPSPGGRIVRFLVPALIAGFLVVYLTGLWITRGDLVVGWELLGAAQGKALIAEHGLLGAAVELWHSSRHFQYWNPTNSVVFALVPGALSEAIPWLHWAQLYTLVFSILTFALAGYLRVSRTLLWVAVAASPTLLSFFLVGYPYVSGALPYVLALLLTYASRHKPAGLGLIGEALAWLGIFELSFHCYELGKTVFIVPFLGALSLSGVPWKRRLLWGVAALGIAYSSITLGGTNVDTMTSGLLAKLARLPAASQFLARQVFVDFFLDGPALPSLGLLCLVLVRRDAAFWRIGFLAQVGLLLLGTVQTDDLAGFMRPRRALLFLSWTAIFVAWTWRDLRGTRFARVALLVPIVAGLAFTARTGFRFYLEPPASRLLPYTESQVDFRLELPLLEDLRDIRALAQKGPEEHFLFYGYNAYPENTSDPQAVPERLYLQTPDATFRKRVHVVDNLSCRYSCVPSIAESKVAALFGDASPPFYVHEYRTFYDRNARGRYLGGSSFTKLPDVAGRTFDTLRVDAYRPSALIRVDAPDESPQGGGEPGLCLWDIATIAGIRPVQWLVTYPAMELKKGVQSLLEPPVSLSTNQPAVYYMEGFTEMSVETDVSFRVQHRGELLVLVNDQAILDLQGYSQGAPPEGRSVTSVRFPQGGNLLRVFYASFGGPGALEMEVESSGRQLSWFCGT